MSSGDFLGPAQHAFCELIALKLQQLRRVVPQGQNSALTGIFVEELVRGFITSWINPLQLLSGALFPHDSNDRLPAEQQNPKQIDGVVFDPRLGPPIIREGGFIVAHPAFCRGIIEIKTSCNTLREFEQRLQLIYVQYFERYEAITGQIMGIVVQDSDPEGHSHPDWMHNMELFDYRLSGHCPIFILFNNDYEPYEAAIGALIRAIFRGPLHHSRPALQ